VLALAALLVGGLPMPAVARIFGWVAVAAFVCYRVVPPRLFESEEWAPWRSTITRRSAVAFFACRHVAVG